MASDTSTDFDERLAAWFADDPQAIKTSAQLWCDMRERSPLYRYGAVTIVTAYEPTKAMLGDAKSFGSGHTMSGTRALAAFAQLGDERQKEALRDVMASEANVMNRNDGARHKRLRGVTAQALKAQYVQRSRDLIVHHADAHLAMLPDAPDFELLPYTHEVPRSVICDLIGIPASDRSKVHACTMGVGAHRRGMNPAGVADAQHAWAELRQYVKWLLDLEREPTGGGGAFWPILRGLYESHGFQLDVPTALVVSLVGGQETTCHLLAVGIYQLLRARTQWDLLVHDSTRLPNAVEELARMVSPSQAPSRQALVDTELAGVPVAKDDTVVAVVAAANRDPAVFADPENIDVNRANARKHLGFGFGPHYCVGVWLARMEAAIILERLIARYPRLALITDDIEFVGPSNLRSLTSLPVTVAA